MTNTEIFAVWLRYTSGHEIDRIALSVGVSRRHVHWAIDEWKRRSRAGER
jgi:DNA-binding transcriptional regulator LsrR (DeoR family)